METKIRVLELLMRNWFVLSIEMFIIGFAFGNLFHIFMDKRRERKSRVIKSPNIPNIGDEGPDLIITDEERESKLKQIQKEHRERERKRKYSQEQQMNNPFNTNPHNIYGHRY